MKELLLQDSDHMEGSLLFSSLGSEVPLAGVSKTFEVRSTLNWKRMSFVHSFIHSTNGIAIMCCALC